MVLEVGSKERGRRDIHWRCSHSFCRMCEGEQEYEMMLDKTIVKREDLISNTLYLDCERAEYFYTPNPPGVVWLTVEEADEMFGEDAPAKAIYTLED